jgi:hypothetical protein
LLRTLHESQLSARSVARQGAITLAEASVDQTLFRLRGGDWTNLVTTALGGGNYWAEVTAAGPTLRYWINGHGLSVSEQRNVQALVQLTTQSVFQGALLAQTSLDVSGNVVTDSYDSEVAPYDPLTAGDNGDIGTNSTSPGAINISGSIAVNGDAMVGAGTSDPNSVLVVNGGSAIITGTVAAQTQNLLFPPVSPPVGMDCSQDLTITNPSQDPVLPPGDYCYYNISVSGGGGLTITGGGQVKIYITGAFSGSGHSTVGYEPDPTQFLMIMTASSTEVTLQGDLTGTMEFYGGIYAPTSAINIHGSAEVFGAVVASEIDITGNAQVHYDESMADLDNPVGVYQTDLLSWQEI